MRAFLNNREVLQGAETEKRKHQSEKFFCGGVFLCAKM